VFLRLPQCPFCDHANPFGAKFCNECGSPLSLKPCRHCEAVNDQAAQNCYKCGAELQAPSPAGHPAPPSPAVEITAVSATPTGLHPQAEDRPLPDPGPDYVLTPPRLGTISEFPVAERAIGIIPLRNPEAEVRSRSLPRWAWTIALPVILFSTVGIAAYYAYRHQVEFGGTTVAARSNVAAPAAVATAPTASATLTVDQKVQGVNTSDGVDGQTPAARQPDAPVSARVVGSDAVGEESTAAQPESTLSRPAIGSEAFDGKQAPSHPDATTTAEVPASNDSDDQKPTPSPSDTALAAQSSGSTADRAPPSQELAKDAAEAARTATAVPSKARHKVTRTSAGRGPSARSEANPTAPTAAAAAVPVQIPPRDRQMSAPPDPARPIACTQGMVALGLCTQTTRTETQ